MTRINCIPVAELTRQHLLAEYRELPRVFGLVRRYQAKGGDPAQLRLHGQPKEYVLGKGHVLFFYDRLSWLAQRHTQLVLEMTLRHYKPTFIEAMNVSHSDLARHWWNEWEPTPGAIAINRARITDRLHDGGQLNGGN